MLISWAIYLLISNHFRGRNLRRQNVSQVYFRVFWHFSQKFLPMHNLNSNLAKLFPSNFFVVLRHAGSSKNEHKFCSSPHFSSVAKVFFTRKCPFFSIAKVFVAKFAEKTSFAKAYDHNFTIYFSCKNFLPTKVSAPKWLIPRYLIG